MNEQQWKEWRLIVEACNAKDIKSINVGSAVRRDAIIAAHDALLWVQERAIAHEKNWRFVLNRGRLK